MSTNAASYLLSPIFSRNQIASRVEAMAREINAFYGDRPIVAICVLKGAFVFFSDLVRSMANPLLELDFVRVASYGAGSRSSGSIRFSKDIEIDIREKHVLIVEDIVDSGRTMRFLLDELAARQPASVALAALVDKNERRELDIQVNFSGFNLPKGFLVGYGLDYAERFRSLPDICELILDQE